MKYSFKDIVNEEMYCSARVMFIAGQYNIFNNIVADELRSRCQTVDDYEEDSGLLDEFGIGNKDKSLTVSNSLDFTSFMEVIDIPNINGKWYCCVDLEYLNKSQLDKFDKYIRHPSDNGLLVVKSADFKDFRWYLKNKVFQIGSTSHLIQLSFPPRKILSTIVIKLFKQRGCVIDDKSAGLFVMRMSTAYDDYETVIDNITLGRHGNLDYETVESGLKGIENYVIDDFISSIIEPLSSDKIGKNRKIYKMLRALISEMGPTELVTKLKYKIEDYIEFRSAINNGIIPIGVKFSVEEAKKKLGDEHRLSRIADFRFRNMAETASLTSLQDWVAIKLILSNLEYSNDINSCERVLYSMLHRSVLNKSRLYNDIGVENILEEGLSGLDNIGYINDDLMLSKGED